MFTENYVTLLNPLIMYKNFILPIFVLLFSFTVQAQRYTDLEIKLYAPETGDTLFTDVQFDITSYIKNIGADTFRIDDSIAFELSFNGSPIQFDFGSGFVSYITLSNKELAPGDSARMNFSFTLNSGWQNGPADVCVAIYSLDSVDAPLDTISSNDTSCASVIVLDPVGVKNVAGQFSGVRVYPNPSHGIVNFDVQLNEPGRVDVSVADITGKRLIHQSAEVRSVAKETITVNTSQLPQGMYIYTITAGGGQQRGKLEVR